MVKMILRCIDSIDTPEMDSIVRHICIVSIQYSDWCSAKHRRVENVLNATGSQLLLLYLRYLRVSSLFTTECVIAMYIYLKQKYPFDTVQLIQSSEDKEMYVVHNDTLYGYIGIPVDVSTSIDLSKVLYINTYEQMASLTQMEYPVTLSNYETTLNDILKTIFIPRGRCHDGIYIHKVDDPDVDTINQAREVTRHLVYMIDPHIDITHTRSVLNTLSYHHGLWYVLIDDTVYSVNGIPSYVGEYARYYSFDSILRRVFNSNT